MSINTEFFKISSFESYGCFWIGVHYTVRTSRLVKIKKVPKKIFFGTFQISTNSDVLNDLPFTLQKRLLLVHFRPNWSLYLSRGMFFSKYEFLAFKNSLTLIEAQVLWLLILCLMLDKLFKTFKKYICNRMIRKQVRKTTFLKLLNCCLRATTKD